MDDKKLTISLGQTFSMTLGISPKDEGIGFNLFPAVEASQTGRKLDLEPVSTDLQSSPYG